MGKSNYSKYMFYDKGRVFVEINKNRKIFTKNVDSALSDIYDSCVDFIISIYKNLEDVDSEDCYMLKAYELLESEIEEESFEYIKDNYSDMEKFSYEDLDNIIQEVFNISYSNLIHYCRQTCVDYMNDRVKNFLSDSSDSKEFAFLYFYDSAFLKSFKFKFEKFKDNCLEFIKFTDESMTEDCFHHIVHLLKPRVIKIVSKNLDELYDNKIDLDVKSICEGLLRDIGIKLGNTDKVIYEELIEEEEYEEQLITFIDDYKELNKMAEDNGFVYVRCNGDHGIFKSNNGMVVIPQGRSIGKGLSVKIQKNINRYKEC